MCLSLKLNRRLNMNSILSRRGENGLIGMRIQILTTLQDSIQKDCSPTLKDLREKGSKVKKLSAVFEKKPWSIKSGECNWWLMGSATLSPQTLTPAVFKFPESWDGSAQMMEILQREQEHVLELNEFIQKILAIVKDGRGYVSMKLREHRNNLIGELRTIYGLHNILILPTMTSHGSSCIKFVQFLIDIIDEGQFYCYIAHKMLEKMMTKLHNEYIFIAQHDYSNHVDPFKMLEFYKNWVSKICNQLLKSPTKYPDDLAICIDAEQKLTELLNQIADAETVTQIVEVRDLPHEINIKILDLVKKHQETCMPMMFLLPKGVFGDLRHPIDIMRLGKFVKSFTIPMISTEHGNKVSRYFVFQKCILYTRESGDKKSYCFEENFWVKDLAFSVMPNEQLVVHLRKQNREVTVDNFDLLTVLVNLFKANKNDEITAEMDMIAYRDLQKLLSYVDDSKKWRRHSIVSLN